MKTLKKSVVWAGVFILPFFLLFLNLKLVMIQDSFYAEQHLKNHVYDQFGKEIADAETQHLLDYLQYGTPLATTFFNEKEKSHMSDVRSLYQKVSWIWYGITIILLLAVMMLDKKDRSILLIGGSLLALILIGALYVMSLSDFSSYFTKFHEIFFANNHWMLNPETDHLIMLFPEQFFRAFVLSIIKNTAIIAGLIGAMGIIEISIT